MCSVGVCAWVRVSAAPRHSCLLLSWVYFVARTAGTPSILVGVFGSGCFFACSACTPPVLAGVCSVAVFAWMQVSAARRHSWLACWSLCFCAHPSCTPQIPAGVFRWVYFCARLPVSCQSWLGCALWVCVLGRWFELRPAIPGWRVLVCVFGCPHRIYPAYLAWGSFRPCVDPGFGVHSANPGLGVGACVFSVRVPPVRRQS